MVNENKRMYIPEENHQGKPEIYLRGSSNHSLPYPLSVISRFGSAAAASATASGRRRGRGRGQPLTPLPIPSTQLPSAGRAAGRPPQPLGEGVFQRKPPAWKSCFKSPSSPSKAELRGGAPGEGAARCGRGLSRVAERPRSPVSEGD